MKKLFKNYVDYATHENYQLYVPNQKFQQCSVALAS